MQTANPLDSLTGAESLRERQTAAGFVAGALREAIQSGKLADGAELNQVALAEHFGISRVPVREALRALEAEGWITALSHRRAVVLAQSPERVGEIFDVRALLEAHLLQKAVARIDVARLERLRDLCDAMDDFADHQQWVAANRDFHRILLEAAESPMTLELIEQLSSQVERYLRLHGAGVIREHEAGHEHRAIVAAVAAGDLSGATQRLAAHIDHTRRRVIDAITRDRALTTTGPAQEKS